MRTRQASARLIGTLAYFSTRSRIASLSSAKLNALTSAPRGPSKKNASDNTASQVFQGGGWRAPVEAAQRWLTSERRSRATRKPASTRTLAAIAGGLEVALLVRAHIGWPACDRADQIG